MMQRIRKILYIGLFLLLSLPFAVFGQEPTMQHFGEKEGMGNSEVYYAFKESKGQMWFATNMGVYRYDGAAFQRYGNEDGLKDICVYEIMEDALHRLWFITQSHRLYYFQNNRFYPYIYNNIIDSLGKESSFTTKHSFQLDSKGNVTIGFNCIGRFEISSQGKVHRFPTSDGVGNIVFESVVKQSGLFNYNYNCVNGDNALSINWGRKMSTVNLYRTADKYRSPHLYTAINKDKILLCCINNRISFISSDGLFIRKEIEATILFSYADDTGLFWVGTNKGVFLYNAQGICIQHFLVGLSVSSITQDHEGGFWFTTLENGIYYWEGTNFQSYICSSKSAENKIKKIQTSDNTVWAASNTNTLFIFKRSDTAQLFNARVLALDTHSIYDLLYEKNKNSLWIATALGLNVLVGNDKSGKITSYQYPDAYLDGRKPTGNISGLGLMTTPVSSTHLSFDNDKNIFLYGKNNFSLVKGDFLLFDSYTEWQKKYCVTIALVDDSHTLWFGTTHGLYRSEFKNNRWLVPAFLGKNNALLNNSVQCLLLVGKKLLIGTRGKGILIYDNGVVTQITKTNGLSSNNINKIAVNNNLLWVATDMGLNRIEFKGNDLSRFAIQKFDADNGLTSNEINDISICGNTLYLATNNGINYIDVTTLKQKSIAPLVSITSFNNQTGLETKNIPIALAYNQNNVQIEFIGISYASRSSLRYKYRMKINGIYEDWVFTDHNYLSLPYLQAGCYDFEVYALNKNGVLSLLPARVSFVIKPPLWATWYAYLFYVLALSGLIYWVMRARINRKQRENALREDIFMHQFKALSAQMNPHFIFNSLNSIQGFILKNDKIGSSVFLSNFAKLMRKVLNNSQHRMITFADEMDAIRAFLELEVIRFEHCFEYAIEIDPDFDMKQYCLPPLLLQPYVENALIHGLLPKEKEGSLHIKVAKSETNVICIIEDNGIGRAASAFRNANRKAHKSMGSDITASRFELINKLFQNTQPMELTYQDLLDSDGQAIGTRVEIILPFIAKDFAKKMNMYTES